MITMTTRELIRAAKFIGGVRNANLSNFELTTSILNNIYRELYQDIIDNSDAYIEIMTGTIDEDGIALPANCYQVEAVYIGNDWEHKVAIEKSSRNRDIAGCWRIINNRLYVDGIDGQNVLVKYSTLPPTLTAPDDPVELHNLTIRNHDDTQDLWPDSIVPYSDDELFITYNDYYSGESHFVNYLYNLEDQEKEQTNILFQHYEGWCDEDAANGNTYYQIDFDDQAQTITNHDTGEDITSMFNPFPNKTMTVVLTSYPHWIIGYADGTVYVDGVSWNAFADTGRITLANPIAFNANDRTGKYFIYQYGTKYYIASFVPDTIISYPDNAFLQLLEYKLASFLAGQAGVSNASLEETLIPEAEQQFYKSITKTTNVVRTNNIYGSRGYHG